MCTSEMSQYHSGPAIIYVPFVLILLGSSLFPYWCYNDGKCEVEDLVEINNFLELFCSFPVDLCLLFYWGSVLTMALTTSFV